MYIIYILYMYICIYVFMYMYIYEIIIQKRCCRIALYFDLVGNEKMWLTSSFGALLS